MNVDRSRFLLLAAALSANACTIIDNRGNHDAAAVDDTGSVDTDSGVDTGSAVDSSVSADASDAASDASDAPLCTDEGITVPACSSGDAGDAGGCALDTLPECTTIPKYFKPRSAKLAIDCLVKLPTCEGTTTNPVWDCAYAALEGACPDSTVDAFCTTLAASCPAADGGSDAGSSELKTECAKYAGGLNADGRTRLQALVTAEGGCTTPLRDLLQSL